jgi:hypothetical protein
MARRRWLLLMLTGCNSVLGIHEAPSRPDGGAAVDGSTAGQSALVFVPASWDFMSLNEGETSADKEFSVQNQGTASTGAITLSTSDPAFVIVSGTNKCDGFQLGPTATCTVSVQFVASGAGASQGSLIATESARTKSAMLTGTSLGANSDRCGLGTDCQSNNCIDGRCCDNALCSGCSSCDVAGEEGTCSPVPAGTDEHGVCTGACDTHSCDGNGHCAVEPNTTSCPGGTSCTNEGTQYGQVVTAGTSSQMCDGFSQTCPVNDVACSSENICDPTGASCQSSCTNDLDCRLGGYCNSSGMCAASGDLFATCARDRQCTSLVCRTGYCQLLCYDNNSCPVGQYCARDTVGQGANACTSCFSSNDCTTAGVGSMCDTNKLCECTSSTECKDAGSPSCLTDTTGAHFCSCFEDASGVPHSCAQNATCVNGAATSYAQACKVVSGYFCNASSECMSNSCSQGICQ